MSVQRLNTNLSQHDSGVVSDGIDPDVYRKNLFQILGLSVNATMTEIKRKQSQLKMASKLGTQLTQTDRLISTLPDAAIEDVEQAVQRFQDPQKRMLDQLFWLWTDGEDILSKTSRELFKKSQIIEVLNLWNKHKTNNSDGVLLHNVAVLSHLLALEYEKKTTESTDKHTQTCEQLWALAYENWIQLLDHEAFWSGFTQQIRNLNDPRLTTGFSHRIRQSLPSLLLSIHSALVLNAAENADQKGLERHKKTLLSSGFEQRLIHESFRQVLSPIRQRIKLICARATSDIEIDPAQNNKVMTVFLKEIRPMLELMDSILPEDDFLKTHTRDEVASIVLRGAISYSNKTDDCKTGLELCKQALTYAANISLRDRIQQNVSIFENNLKFTICHFCGKNQSHSDAMAEVAMYGNVQKEYTFRGTRVHYNTRKVPVPRCLQCKKYHDNRSRISFVISLVVGLVTALIILGMYGVEEGICPGIFFGAIALFVSIFIVGFVANLFLPSGVKPEGKGADFFVVKEFEMQGWAVGDSPPK